MTERYFRKNGKWAKITGERGKWACAHGWKGQTKAIRLFYYPTKEFAIESARYWVKREE
jgi:hypothetical protein